MKKTSHTREATGLQQGPLFFSSPSFNLVFSSGCAFSISVMLMYLGYCIYVVFMFALFSRKPDLRAQRKKAPHREVHADSESANAAQTMWIRRIKVRNFQCRFTLHCLSITFSCVTFTCFCKCKFTLTLLRTYENPAAVSLLFTLRQLCSCRCSAFNHCLQPTLFQPLADNIGWSLKRKDIRLEKDVELTLL